MGTLCSVFLCLKPYNLIPSTEYTTNKDFLGGIDNRADLTDFLKLFIVTCMYTEPRAHTSTSLR